jgi:hypothetical protein
MERRSRAFVGDVPRGRPRAIYAGALRYEKQWPQCLCVALSGAPLQIAYSLSLGLRAGDVVWRGVLLLAFCLSHRRSGVAAAADTPARACEASQFPYGCAMACLALALGSRIAASALALTGCARTATHREFETALGKTPPRERLTRWVGRGQRFSPWRETAASGPRLRNRVV